jgi:imidazolonepropionase-like amidohydrolase
MQKAGVRIHAGTDTQVPFLVPGAALHRELRILAAAGLGPDGALAAATTVPGRSLGVPGLGRVEPGSPADLLVFREDPTLDLDALDTLEAVIADGRLYRVADLEAQLERYQKHHEGRIFDAVSTPLVRQVLQRLFAEDDL